MQCQIVLSLFEIFEPRLSYLGLSLATTRSLRQRDNQSSSSAGRAVIPPHRQSRPGSAMLHQSTAKPLMPNGIEVIRGERKKERTPLSGLTGTVLAKGRGVGLARAMYFYQPHCYWPLPQEFVLENDLHLPYFSFVVGIAAVGTIVAAQLAICGVANQLTQV